MVVGEPNINNIMGGIENTGSVRLHNHRKKLKQRFDIIKKLGQGTYGKVQLGINKETGQEVAIKTIKKSKIETEADLVRIRREIQIMSSVQHPNIIHIYEVFENREKMVLVMEYAAGGELYDYLSERKVLSEEEARRIFRQISTACYYCHKHKICHRDLKLENILLDERGNAKIADFGLSNVFDDQRLLSTFCGSPLYASPEIVKGTPYQGPEVDCWSLGVLLYTLVYGAMPFDGSNFKRLVRQISQGDYFEPKKPSRASPLIRDMLTVNPRNRADIEKICSHWWVNECYEESCLEISEELANQTPVRLDLLLSLAPPPPQLESEKLMVTGDAADESGINSESSLPTRSQSVGSIMEFANPAERRIKDLLCEDAAKVSSKRKLESTVSTDQIPKDDVAKRKEKIIKENTVADITLHGPIVENVEDEAMRQELKKSITQTLSKETMDVEQTGEYVDLSAQGAACSEIIADAKKNEEKDTAPDTRLNHSAESNVDKENVEKNQNAEEVEKQSKIPAKRKVVKKKVLADRNDNLAATKIEQPTADKQEKGKSETSEQQKMDETPAKPVERRKSRIFETAEKFQSMISANEGKTKAEKPKKIVIPGVSVGGYKKEFERKASLTTPPKGSLLNAKKTSVDKEPSVETSEEPAKDDLVEKISPSTEETPLDDRRIKVQNAVNIISSVLDKDGTRKSKSRPCMVRKPPVPFGLSGRSASGSISTPPLHSPPPLPEIPPTSEEPSESVHGSKPAQVVEQTKEETPEENKTSSAEITLKSATLPRRKTTKAEIKLDYPAPKPATMGFKTEMAHRVEGPPKVATQRSEVTFPVSSPTSNKLRSASLEPETRLKQTPRERIIPISFERETEDEKREGVASPPAKPPITKTFQTQRSVTSQRSNSLSRQSTQESDSEAPISTGEPIRKSPREYIIPIAVEGGGYVTPRAGSLEPSETGSTISSMTSKSKFGRNRRLNEREGSEDESPFAALHRHSSFGRDSDNEDSRRDNMFRMHSLRSSRPRKAVLEHNDSFSSGEEDDDDGFELLTAENLFSTLLSRVRDLTQRLNVDGRPGFPSSRLLSSHFDHGTNFWNMHNRTDPLSRFSPIGRTNSHNQNVESSATSRNAGTPWRRSVSRDLASDIESVFNNPVSPPPTHTATLPRGDSNRENLNLTDLDLKKLKLSDEDALALSFLTPGLSRRIQRQLLAQLAPSEARKLSRTLSLRTTTENAPGNYSRSISLENNAPVKSNTVTEAPSLLRSHIKSNLPVVNRASSCLNNYQRKPDDNSPESSTSSSSLNKYLTESSSLMTSDAEKTNGWKFRPFRRTSRFLRPDFYETPKDGNYYLKEKKEREMETQKVLKEIRDKRRFRERSESRIDSDSNEYNDDADESSLSMKDEGKCYESTDDLLRNVSVNIRNLESNVNELAKQNGNNDDSNKILAECVENNNNKPESAPPIVAKKVRVSKIARPKSYPAETTPKIQPESKLAKPTKSESGKNSKNKFLQTIERKFEKLRSFSNSPTSSDEVRQEKKSAVECTIRRLREQSLPKNADTCVTESELIKRAVSVEDLSISDPKQLQASRKSVTKILNLFKKYEEKAGGDKKSEKTVKVKKTKDDKVNNNKSKNSQLNKTDKNNSVGATAESDNLTLRNSPVSSKPERPRSLLLDNKTKPLQPPPVCNGENEPKLRTSKLPVTSFRRSLNLENAPKLYKNPDIIIEATPTTSGIGNAPFVQSSPCDDNEGSFDSWSVCSDHHPQDLTSPVSPCGHFYSADENESVSDRIRRKSFYTRFNEKKRPRKTTLGNYRDLDLYKEMNNRKVGFRAPSYGSLDRRLGSSNEHNSYYGGAGASEYLTNDRACTPSNASRSDDCEDVSNCRYRAYNAGNQRRSASVYDDDLENANTLDDPSAAEQNRIYSFYNQPSRNNNRPYSPASRHTSVEPCMINKTTTNYSTTQHHF